MSATGAAKVLILEDDPGVLKLERRRLERSGFVVVTATTPEEALHAIEAGDVALMVLDYQLAGIASGLDFQIQVREAGFEIPSILVTGFSDEGILARALRTGIRDFLPKTPDYLDFLGSTVTRVLAQVETERALETRQRQLTVERQRSSQLQRLAAISSTLNATLDVESVLSLLSDEARTLIGAGQAIVSLVLDDDWSGAIHSVATADPKGAPVYPVPNGQGPAAKVCDGPGPRRVSRTEAERPSTALPDGARDWLAAPLIGRLGRNMGLVQLFDKPGDPFTEDDESILVQLTQMASVAVENARFYQELRENDRRKDEFLAMLAHELRNPLAAIDGAAQVAQLEELTEGAAWANDVILRQTQQLARLIDGLLEISRINEGKIRLKKESLDLGEVIEHAVEVVAPRVEARRHTLKVTPPASPITLDADPARLEQVLVNLLVNAAKYTPEGGEIQVESRREGREVVVEIADNGVGIAPEMLPRVFEPFIQVEQTIDRAQGGLGIGLTLVRRLVEMHGGSVSARSEGLGKGSVFTIRLPTLATAPGSAPITLPHERAARLSSTTPRRLRILIVDDSVDTARAMNKILSSAGFETAMAHDGHDALTRARETPYPDVILLDLGLPRIDGYEVAVQIRNDPNLSDLPLIAISGYGTEHDRKRSREAGFNQHLAKPVDFDVLLSLLNAIPLPSSVGV